MIGLKDPPNSALLDLFEGCNVDILAGDESPLDAVQRSPYDIALLESDLDVLKALKGADPRLEVILIGGESTKAVEAVKQGASAFFEKPFDIAALRNIISHILELIRLRRETGELERILSSKYTFHGIVGRNPRMLEVLSFIRRIAPYYKTVTIVGETGTGKEVIAKALHEISPVGKDPFVAFNCGGVVESLVESELFGHKKGAFTGAVEDKVGLFEAAGTGTLFLDEIGELPLSVQAHLLRVLQDGEFRRVGSNKTLRAKCRVVAATNKDLEEEVKKGNFREDLFYRLTPLKISVPPLRERKDDIPLLLRHFLRKFCKRTGKRLTGISRPAQALLLSYDWPGNVRELENVIERAAILTRDTFIGVDDLPAFMREARTSRAEAPMSLDELNKRHIEKVLRQCGGNRTRAAEMLGISRRSLLRKMEKYSIK